MKACPITEEIESCDHEPPDGTTLEPPTNIGKITKGSQVLHITKMWTHIFNLCTLDSSIYG